jgi:hypothetical protein
VSGPCSDSFRALARELGGISCETAHRFVTFRSPGALRHFSMPIVEVVMIGGALAALAHALRVRRTTGRAANLALWLAAVVFVLALEPPLYFPQQLGAGNHLDVIFAHNVFTVQFLYDRLPLYIVALYPSGIYLAYTLVERFQVFERRGRLVGAISVGFVHQCFYEIFDHLGPQFRWWAWNPRVPYNTPALGSVPLVSMVIFAIVAPAALAYAWRLLVGEPEARGAVAGAPLGGARLAGRTLLAGLVAPILMATIGAPVSVLMLAPHPSHTLIAVLLYGAIVVTAAITVHALAGAHAAASPPSGDRFLDRYPLWHGTIYLVTFAGLWLAALPAPTGSPVYAAACALFCVATLWRAARPGAQSTQSRASRRAAIRKSTAPSG